MKKVVLLIALSFSILTGFSQNFEIKQVDIPLNNTVGVPYHIDADVNDYAVDGFEVDNKGRFYFMGGKRFASLAIFDGAKQLFRKTYSEFPPGQLYFWKDCLYTLDVNKKDLWVLDPINGAILKKYGHISNQNIDSYLFADSSLIIQTSSGDKIKFDQFNLKGQYLKKAPGESNIPPFLTSQSTGPSQVEFLGEWNGNDVFWDLIDGPGGGQIQRFWNVDQNRTVLGTRDIVNKNNIFGKAFFENPQEHRRVRNGNLYVLARSRKSNNAVISIVPLDAFFTKKA